MYLQDGTLRKKNFFGNTSTKINTLKLRGSIGQMGDDGTAAFQFLEGIHTPAAVIFLMEE